MGSEIFAALKEQGQQIDRGGGESMIAFPDAFIVIGVDITADKLAALYPDNTKPHMRARAIIAGIRDKTRTVRPPPDAFVATLRHGVTQAITLANLGPDRRGKVWIVVALGRQRTIGLRIWNDRNPANRHRLRGMLEPFPHNMKAGVDAELSALEANAASNVFVAMSESSRADHAVMLTVKGKSPEDIAITIGARDAEHVQRLLYLADCAPEVQEAVDAGKIPIADCERLCKLPAEEQVRRITRKQAGPSSNAKNEAAPARAKTLPAHVLARVEAEVKDSPVICAALALARGDYATAMAVPELRAALLRAGYDEEKGRLPAGPNARTKEKSQ